MIRLHDIHKTYRMGAEVVRALRGVTLSIEPGEFIAITGPSGSGKSTLMHIIGLLDVPDTGSYRLDDREVAHLDEDDLAVLRRQRIGFVFQQFHLLPRTSAAENVSLPLIYSLHRHDLARAHAALAQVGLADRARHRPNELSGGQQQRVAIARALINAPAILLADEPTGNLDSASQHEILGVLRDLNRRGMTVILVTHEEDVAGEAARRIQMRDGEIVSDQRYRAPTQAVASAPATATPVSRSRVGEFFAHVRQGLQALAANRVRTALSVLGILIGVAAVIAVLALGRGAQEAIEQQLSSLGTNRLLLSPGFVRVGGVAQQAGSGTRTRITLDDVAAIRQQVSGVRAVGPTVSGRGRLGFGNKNWDSEVVGAVPAYADLRASQPIAGRFFTEEENRSRSRVAVVGLTVVRELFAGSNPVGESIRLNRVSFTVIGVLPQKGATGWRDQDDVIVIPLNTAMRRVLGKQFVDYVDIEAMSPDRIEPLKREVYDFMLTRHRIPLSQSEGAYRLRDLSEVQAVLTESSRTMTWLLSSIAAIALLVGGIGIMNIMLVSVTERTREIGLRKAVGARPRDIQMQFLIEAVVVSLLGGVAGVVFGWAVTLVMAYAAGWSASVTVGSVALAFAFSAAVGLIFGFYPARRAAALNPIEALRFE